MNVDGTVQLTIRRDHAGSPQIAIGSAGAARRRSPDALGDMASSTILDIPVNFIVLVVLYALAWY